VLVHIEIQSQEEVNFSRRMFVYHYRLRDKYDLPIVSLAVLGDERVSWRPSVYETALWGCELSFRFPVVKLRDWVPQRAVLEADPNPFAAIVLAHLAAQETRQNASARSLAKFALTRRLYSLGYDRERIFDLFRFIDWMLQLPQALEIQFHTTLQQFEEERNMTYITSVERLGREEGRQEGRREALLPGIALALELKFGDVGVALIPEVQALTDVAQLQAVLDSIRGAATVDEVRAVYRTSSDR
jgi:hypothetical protein